MGYSRCNPFGSEQVRYGGSCAPVPTQQAYEQEARRTAIPVSKAKEQIEPGELKLHPNPPRVGPNQAVIPSVPDILPVRPQHCINMRASSGRILASSDCQLVAESVIPPHIIFLASSGTIRASSTLHITG